MKDNKLKILIVEDDFRLAVEWQNELIDQGYEASYVSSSDDVPGILSNNYDCFIIDLFHVENDVFQEDGGIKIISSVRKYNQSRSRKNLIIAVTGYFRKGLETTVSTEDIAKSLGANVVLKKPLSFDKIIGLINNWKNN